jgi:AraC-like DNA-binding protein
MRTKLAPSLQSLNPLSRPIVMLKRLLSKDHTVRSHKHNWGQFLYAQKGVLAITTDSFRYICPAEQGIWLPSNVPHEVTTLTDCVLSSLYIDNSETSSLDNCAHMIQVSALLKMLIIEAVKFTDDYDWQGNQGRHFRLVRDLVGSAKKVDTQLPYPATEKLLHITRHLSLHPDNNQSLEAWGRVVGASSRTLSRDFKKETGLTFSDWRIRLKLQVAIRQLHEGQSVTNVALNLGYETTSAFTFMFRTKLGKAPSKFIAAHLLCK